MDLTDPSPAAPASTALGGARAPSWLTSEAVASVVEAEQRPFTDAEYDDRLGRVRHRMSASGLDALIVFRPSSVEYLSGYHSAETTPQPLLLTDSDTVLYVPDLELGRALASSRVDSISYCGYADALRSLELFFTHAVNHLPPRARVGIEFAHSSTPPQAVRLLQEQRVRLADAGHLVETERLTLSPAEIGCVEEAAVTTQAGVEAAIHAAGKPHATDSSVAAAVAAALFERAGSASAWGPVVATGHRAGIPHSSWVHRPLSSGTTFLEFAGTHHRYHAPVMRTLSFGRPSAEDRRLAELSRAAVHAVLDNARAGVTCAEVANRAARAIAPLPEDVVFHHLFGYPVGLAHPPHWMDGAPFYLTPDNHVPLREGMVFHIPGSFRSFGNSGVGLSQTFVVEAHAARVLTHGAAEVLQL